MMPNPRLLKLAGNSRPWLILTIGLGFFSGILSISQARFISQLVSQVFLEGAGLRDVSGFLFWILLAFSTRALLAWASSLSGKTIAVQIKSLVQKTLLDKLEVLGPAYLMGERSGELSNTLTEGVEALDAYFSQYLPQLVLSALVPTTILFFVFPMDILSGTVLLVTAPLIPYFMFLIGGSAKKITDRQYSTLSRLAGQFLDSLQGMRTLKLFNQAKAEVEKIRQTSDEYRKTTLKVLQVTFLSALVLELLATLSTAVVAVQIGLRLLYFRVSLEQALFLLIIAPEFYIPLRTLGLRFHAGMEGQSAAERIFQILDAEPLRKFKDHPEKSPASVPAFQSLELQGVSFQYPGDRGASLKDINLRINQGDQIALVGASGAGKSTLASLILGFFPPGEGQILVNGEDLSHWDLSSWRDQIAWVPQEPALFQGTISANIRLARPDAGDGAVAAAASAAHLADFINTLPEGYHHRIGEGGARLSGGQAQRLALARAFLKDAPILLLDEPTSQLDPIIESQLADATRRLMKGKTVLTIAHRLNTVFQADRILVLDQGRIVESGTHLELLAAGGVYKSLVQAYTGAANLADLPEFEEDSDPGDHIRQSPTETLTSTAPEINTTSPQKKVLGRLLRFFKPHFRQVLGSVILGAITIASSIGLMGASAWLIVTASTHPNIAVLQVAIVGVRFFGISRGISRYLERLVSHNLTFKLLTRLRVWFYESLVPLAPARTSQYRAGDLLNRITADIKTLEDFYVRSLAPPLVAILIGLGTGIFFYSYHPLLAILLGGTFLISGIGVPLVVRFLARKPGQELVRTRAVQGGALVNFIQGLPDLIVYGQIGSKKEGILEQNRRYAEAQLKLALISGLNAGLLIFFSNLAMWLSFIVIIPQTRSGMIPGVMLAALGLMALSAFEAIQPLPQAMEILASSREAGARLMEILDADPPVNDPDHPVPFPLLAALHIKDLTFRYPGRQPAVLEEIDLDLQEGQILAVVGPSGSGKTTLGNLITRLWSGFEGEICLGPEKIRLETMAQDEVRRGISVVSQGACLFQDSLRANIALGKPGAKDAEILAAAERARLGQWIRRLPEGLDTVVGERGTRISAGERQRVAIARALLKDAPLFLLDEPTANLDPVTEKEFLDTLFTALAGKTTLLITHRLVGLEKVDQILVLYRGRIIERGTESELLKIHDGFYRRMWTLQNRILNYH
jgi:ATP-binding cassette subfamily C protein CydCD